MVAASQRPLVPLRVRLYVAATVGAALSLAPLAWRDPGASHGLRAAEEAAILAVLVVIARRDPIRLGPRRRIDVGTIAEVAAVLLLPGPLAVLTLAAAAIIADLGRHALLLQRLFNTAVAALRAILGALAYVALRGIGTPSAGELVAMLAAAAVMYASTTLLVRGIVAIQLGESPLKRAQLPTREILATELGLSLTGIMAALATHQQAWALPLLAAPAFVGRHALRSGVALQEQTRRAEAALQETQAALAVREKFLSVAAHELRTPLTALKAFNYRAGRLVQRRASAEDIAPLLGEIDLQVDRMTQLIGELLDAERLATGRLPITLTPTPLVPIMEHAVAVARASAEGRVIELTLPTIAPEIMADGVRLEQVLLNLIDNAVKYSPATSPVRVTLCMEDRTAAITVEDKGAGIPPEDQARIFERFHRAGNIDPGISGLGLGLYIAHELVRAHGGTVTVVSAPGEGSTFTVRLPWRDAPNGANRPDVPAA